jgi:hypothetical protein
MVPHAKTGTRKKLVGFVWAAAGVLGGFALLAVGLKEWQSGAAFYRYRNWEGQWVSHADGLVVGGVAVATFLPGIVWRAWDLRHERGALKKMSQRSGAAHRGTPER